MLQTLRVVKAAVKKSFDSKEDWNRFKSEFEGRKLHLTQLTK